MGRAKLATLVGCIAVSAEVIACSSTPGTQVDPRLEQSIGAKALTPPSAGGTTTPDAGTTGGGTGTPPPSGGGGGGGGHTACVKVDLPGFTCTAQNFDVLYRFNQERFQSELSSFLTALSPRPFALTPTCGAPASLQSCVDSVTMPISSAIECMVAHPSTGYSAAAQTAGDPSPFLCGTGVGSYQACTWSNASPTLVSSTAGAALQAAVGLPTMSVGGTSYAGDGADVPECAVPSWGLDLRTIVGIRDANHVAIRTPAYGYPYRTQDQSAWQSAVSRAFAEAAFLVDAQGTETRLDASLTLLSQAFFSEYWKVTGGTQPFAGDIRDAHGALVTQGDRANTYDLSILSWTWSVTRIGGMAPPTDAHLATAAFLLAALPTNAAGDGACATSVSAHVLAFALPQWFGGLTSNWAASTPPVEAPFTHLLPGGGYVDMNGVKFVPIFNNVSVTTRDACSGTSTTLLAVGAADPTPCNCRG